jgi:RND family efflux transporter MFP subunit
VRIHDGPLRGRAWVAGGAAPVLLGAVALATALSGCSGRSNGTANRSAAATLPSDSIRVTVASARALGNTGPGFTTYLEAERQAELVAETSGLIREIRVREGDRVAAGDTLLLIDDRDARLAFQRDQAESDWARSQYDRMMALDKEGHVSAQEVDQARLAVARTEAALGISRVALTRCAVLSPIAGLVWMIRVEALHHVADGQPLLRVTDPDRMRASVYLPDEYRSSVRVGTRVRLMPVRGGTGIDAVVSRVDPLTDPASGTFKATATFRRGRAQPEPGAEVRFVIPGAAAAAGCVVPLTTLVQTVGDSTWVWRWSDGRVYRAPIQIGPIRGDGLEIDSGLREGTTVVVSSNRSLQEGDAVQIVEAP